VNNAKTTVIPLTLPALQAMPLAQFVKRMDFETITRFAAVTVVCDDGKSEADLIWLALIALRGALAEASARPAGCHTQRNEPEPGCGSNDGRTSDGAFRPNIDPSPRGRPVNQSG
jgi:hypothetical protein